MASRRDVLIVAGDGFEDPELLIPQERCREQGLTVDLATPQGKSITGMRGNVQEAMLTLEDVNASHHSALLLPGGEGTPLLRERGDLLHLIRQFHRDKKCIGAICWAPTLLGEAGILEGVQATACRIPDVGNYEGCDSFTTLRRQGAKVSTEAVVQDGSILTANGPSQAEAFAAAFITMLKDQLQLAEMSRR